MIRRILAVAAIVMCMASVASAQYRTSGRSAAYGSGPSHKAELIPLGGYAWTLAMDVYGATSYAEIDLSDAAYYGVALDINVQSSAGKNGQVRLLYRRSDAEVQYRSVPLSFDTDAAVEYWQIGGLGGIMRGNAMPFTAITLGGTRVIVGDEDEWKFSMIFGLGVKVYSSPKVGFMVQGNFPITFTDSWGGVTVGTGGAGVAIGGTGISQLDIGGGLIITF